MLILFDIDDTLLDHSYAARAAASVLHRTANVSESVDEFLAKWIAAQDRHYPRFLTRELTYEGQRRERVREAIRADFTDDEADQAFAVYLSEYRSNWRLFGDVLPCLRKLTGHCLGIISNGRGAEQRTKLAKMEIAEYFDGVFISDDCPAAKPDARLFLHACSTMEVAPADAIYIGDRYDLDAEGARRAGLHGIWLDRHRTLTEHHAAPIIHTLDELTSHLDAIARRH